MSLSFPTRLRRGRGKMRLGRVRSQGATALSAPSNEVVVTVTGINPPGLTRWAGLVANGEGATIPGDDDCGGASLGADVTATIVQSGASLTGILSNVIRVATGPAFIGFTFTEPFSGTVTGSLADGSGNFSITTPSATVTGTFANGRLTGSIVVQEGGGGTVIMRRQ
jgi:hypothetical protein